MITVRSISDKNGGNGGFPSDDFKDIINNSIYGGGENIKSIEVKGIEVQGGDVLNIIRFTYVVETEDGKMKTDYPGNSFGKDQGSTKHIINVTNDEQVLKISGSIGTYVQSTVVRYLEIQTSKTVYRTGIKTPDDRPFEIPFGVLYGSGGDLVDSIGAYEIINKEITNTCPSSSSASPSGIANSPDNSIIVGLSVATGILGMYFLVTMGILLWRKLCVSTKFVPTAGYTN